MYYEQMNMKIIIYLFEIYYSFRLMWIGITLVSFITANTLISTFWSRYKSNPTRMNVETNYAPMAQISFPAVTFCSSDAISLGKVNEFVKTLYVF